MLKLLLSAWLVLSPLTIVVGFELGLIHVNDIHVRFEETDTYSGTCKPGKECFGGLARLSQTVKDIRAKDPNSIFVNGGDFYQGTSWYTLFKWKVVAPFANKLNFDASSPGNHEFDDGVDGFVPFLKNITFPIICANIDVSNQTNMEGLYNKSVVVERGGRKIGLIGFLTPETRELSSPGNIRFLDEVETISKEAKRLKNAGVDILIAVGHSGYTSDQKIAKEVPDIDVVVGGHSHSFLFTGPQPSTEIPEGPYPTLVKQESGRVVPVVQAYAFTKYLGYLKLTFDDQGELTSWKGSPILLNSSYPEDPEILEDFKPWKEELTTLYSQVIGETKVLLSPSRSAESNLGDFIADSMVDWYVDNPQKRAKIWAKASTALLNSGGIRGSFDVGNITLNDLMTVLPFTNTIDLVTLRGQTILDAFEFSASKLNEDGSGSAGAFLQVAGFDVTLDLRREPGQRVTKLLVRCVDCVTSQYNPIEPAKIYDVVVAGYLANGGDGFNMVKEQKLDHFVGPEDTVVFRKYLDKKSPITQGVENRIKIFTSSSPPPSADSASSAVTLSMPNSQILHLTLTTFMSTLLKFI